MLDGAGDLVRRRGDVYLLDVGAEVCDVQRVAAAVASGRAAMARGDLDAAGEAFRSALELHRGELLPEEGAADWVVDKRQAVVADVTEAATGLAEILLDRGDAGGRGAGLPDRPRRRPLLRPAVAPPPAGARRRPTTPQATPAPATSTTPSSPTSASPIKF